MPVKRSLVVVVWLTRIWRRSDTVPDVLSSVMAKVIYIPGCASDRNVEKTGY